MLLRYAAESLSQTKHRPLKVEGTSDSQTYPLSILKENIAFVTTQTSSLNQKQHLSHIPGSGPPTICKHTTAARRPHQDLCWKLNQLKSEHSDTSLGPTASPRQDTWLPSRERQLLISTSILLLFPGSKVVETFPSPFPQKVILV